MSDLFHEDIPDEYIGEVFEVMEKADHHVFQVLTKRQDRLVDLAPKLPWPSNVWMGVSIENRRFVHRALWPDIGKRGNVSADAGRFGGCDVGLVVTVDPAVVSVLLLFHSRLPTGMRLEAMRCWYPFAPAPRHVLVRSTCGSAVRRLEMDTD